MEEDLYCELHCGSALHSPICLPDMAVVAVGRGPTTEVISRKCSRRQVYTTFDCCLHTNIGSNNGVELVSLPREGLASETSVECTQCHLGYPPLAQDIQYFDTYVTSTTHWAPSTRNKLAILAILTQARIAKFTCMGMHYTHAQLQLQYIG